MRRHSPLQTGFIAILVLLATAGELTGCGGTGGSTSASSPSYTVGGTVTGLAGSALVLQSTEGAEFAVTANGSFVLPSTITSGSPYAITIKRPPTNPGQNCVIANGSGQVTDANVTNVVVTCTTRRSFGYASSHSGIFCFAIDMATGALTPNAASPCASGVLTGVAVDPSGKFAYATVSTVNEIGVYAIANSTGNLTAIPGSQLSAGNIAASFNPVDVVVDPSGHFAFMANYSGSISSFAIDADTGALTTVPGSPFLTAPAAIAGQVPGANSVTVDPSARFVYAAINQGNNISAYTIDANSGTLTTIPGSPFAAGTVPMSVRIDPSGKFAYVTNAYSNDVSAYSIDSTSGALSPIAGSPFSTGGSFPTGLAIDPSGRFLYVPNSESSTISAFSIDPSTGALSPLPGSPFASDPNPFSAAVHPSGQYLFVGSAYVSVYIINADTGALTPVVGSPFTSIGDGNNTYSFAFSN